MTSADPDQLASGSTLFAKAGLIRSAGPGLKCYICDNEKYSHNESFEFKQVL